MRASRKPFALSVVEGHYRAKGEVFSLLSNKGLDFAQPERIGGRNP